MALVTPIALSVDAFDATNDQIFYFSSVGGDQVTKNRITIRDNATNDEVYQNTVETFDFFQTVPSGTLTNGTYYNYYFNTYNVSDDISDDSNAIQFYCYTSPTITFTNLPSGNVVNTSSYSFDVTYDQSEGELLNYLVFNLYDGATGTLIDTSGELYSTDTPPIDFSHLFTSFEDGQTYKISADAVSINGTISTSGQEDLTVQYTNPEIFSAINLTNKCNDGYVEVDTNLVVADGTASPTPPTYVESDTMIDLAPYEYTVEWDEGFDIPSDFICRLQYKVARTGNILYLQSSVTGEYKYILELVREIPFGETALSEYFVLRGYDNGIEVVRQKSNYLTELNNNSLVFIWIKKVGTTYELIAEVISTETNVITWNDTSNVEYDKITNIPILGGLEDTGDEFISLSGDMSSGFPMGYIKIENGVFDHLQFSQNTTDTYSTTIPEWSDDIKFDCDFEANINGGNTDIILSQISFLRIKRRLEGTFHWVQLYEKSIETVDDLDIIYQDYYCSSGKTYNYALVPVLNDGSEGDYITDEIDTSFRFFFISDADSTFRLVSKIELTSSRVKQVGKHITLGSQYPIMTSNGIENYEEGSLSGVLYGYDFIDTRTIDTEDVNTQTIEFGDFLTNGKAKIIKDWNGRIKLVRMNTTSIPLQYNTITGYTTISVNWVEQGDYNTEDDLVNNGLIEG